MSYESTEYVQFFLDQLEPMQQFAVIFHKQDGSQGCIVGNLDPNKADVRKVTIPVQTETDGWKSFSKERVLWIGYPDQFEAINSEAG
jgi:hypothetical protein